MDAVADRARGLEGWPPPEGFSNREEAGMANADQHSGQATTAEGAQADGREAHEVMGGWQRVSNTEIFGMRLTCPPLQRSPLSSASVLAA